jgi:hypothetical protein
VATDLNSTYSYTNEMIIAYLIAIAIPLTQKDYIQQFETISTQIWKKSSYIEIWFKNIFKKKIIFNF